MDNVKFGKFIRKARKEKELTQKQLADMLHVSDKTVSKWENGAGFPDIKLLEPLAESLEVSLLELMQSERIVDHKIDKEDAEQVVAETISRSEQAEERKRQMWKVKILLGACACGILYLAWTGICYLLGKIPAVSASGNGYTDPVFFYVWAGLLTMLCGAAAVYILWKNEEISDVKIGRHKIKGAATILMDILVVLLLHTYLSNIANNQEQLLKLPEALPIHAYLTCPDGTSQAGLFIREEVAEALLSSVHVKDLKLTTRLKAGLKKADEEKEENTDLFLEGINCLAAGGLTDESVVWNAGEDSSFLQGNEAKCIVSAELFKENGWRLGEKITLCQYYYEREDERYLSVRLEPLETTEYEIAGYADFKNAGVDMLTDSLDVLLPLQTVREIYKNKKISFFADSASFDVADALKLNEFKQEMKDLSLISMSPFSEDHSMNGRALNVDDSTFIHMATHLRRVIDAVETFFPFLLALIVCVGYLVTLLMLQSRKKEMALLRSLGLSRRKCFQVFFTEQLILVLAGVVVGSVLSVLLQGNYGGSSALTGCLVGIFYMLGNSLALWKLMKVSVMEALFQAE